MIAGTQIFNDVMFPLQLALSLTVAYIHLIISIREKIG